MKLRLVFLTVFVIAAPAQHRGFAAGLEDGEAEVVRGGLQPAADRRQVGIGRCEQDPHQRGRAGHLSRVIGGWRAGPSGALLVRSRDVAEVRLAREHHRHAVDPERDPAVRRGSHRQRVEQELQHGQNSGPVKTGFLRLAEEPESSEAASEQKRITFEIAVTVGVKDPAVFKHSFRQ
jgi:hypothetical protein